MNTSRWLPLLLVLACSDDAPAPVSASASAPADSREAELVAATEGDPTYLRIDGDVLLYCDLRGGHTLELEEARVASLDEACAPVDPNVACAGLAVEAVVRSPGTGPDDVVDVAGKPYSMQGKVRDCVSDGSRLAIATTSVVVLIDLEKQQLMKLSRKDGGDRVAIGGDWVVWSSGSALHARQVPASE